MARGTSPNVAAAASSWELVEAALGSVDAPRLWDEHWRIVRRLRRSYVRTVAGLGAMFATVAGLSTLTVPVSWPDGPLFAAILLLSGPVVLGSGLRSLTAATVAPFVPKPRHLWARWASVALYELVVVMGLVARPGPWWAVIGGLAVAVPLWTAAALEHRQPVPQFPAAWRRHLTR